MKSFSSSLALTLSAFLASTCQPTAVSAQNITYGEILYIQNFNYDSMWAMRRDDGNPWQYGWNLLQREDDVVDAQFYLVSQLVYADQDPKAGECVKYGDEFYISDGGNLFWWFDVPTSQIVTLAAPNGHQWSARSNQGNGIVGPGSQPDPLLGTCVQENAVVFLQMMDRNGIWAGVYDVPSSNLLKGGFIGASPTMSVSQQIVGPMWILTTTISDGSTNNALPCPAIPNTSTGKWEIVQGSINNLGQTISITTGTTSTQSTSITETQKWQASITSETTAGFSFEGITAQEKISVGFTYSSQQEESVANAVTHSKTVETTEQFPAGQVWQFKYTTQDACEMSGFDIFVNEFALTETANEYPCCLPGLFANATNPHGPCVAGSPCNCAADICNPQTSTRALRGSKTN